MSTEKVASTEVYRYPAGIDIDINGSEQVIDLGCGPTKIPRATGVDYFKFPGVDIVCNLNQYPWPIDDNQYDSIWSNQFIEHVDDVSKFLAEIHRIGKNGAKVHITTPHFSHAGSWGDPTHIRHLGVKWHNIITKSSNYMYEKMPEFELVSNKIIFGKPNKLRNLITRMIIKLDGLNDWERKWCFIFRGENIYTTLKIIK